MRLEHQLAVLEAIDFRIHVLSSSLLGLRDPCYRLGGHYARERNVMEKKIALLETAKEEIQSKNWP